jgi:hypothetical protein
VRHLIGEVVFIQHVVAPTGKTKECASDYGTNNSRFWGKRIQAEADFYGASLTIIVPAP